MKVHSILLDTNRGRRSGLILRRSIALSVIAAVCSSSVCAMSSRLDEAAGRISSTGDVQVNGQRVTSGQTLFSKSQIVTSRGSESLIDFANSVRIRLTGQ